MSRQAAILTTHLNRFGNDVAESDEQYKQAKAAGKMLIDRIERAAKQHRPARVLPAGSLEKGTALAAYLDSDIIIFLNTYSPFTDAIQEWKTLVKQDAELNVDDVQSNDRCLQIHIDGLGVDFTPATNFVREETSDVNGLQHKEALNYVLRTEHSLRKAVANNLSGALSVATMELIKSKSPFTHQLIRLCKFWNLTLYTDLYINGRSSLIELLAMHAAIEEEQSSATPNILSGFRRFLKSLVHARQFSKQFAYTSQFVMYSSSLIPDDITSAWPLLMDPSNPWNNRFADFLPAHWAVFVGAAGATLHRIKVLLTTCGSTSNYQQLMAYLFLPQLRVRRKKLFAVEAWSVEIVKHWPLIFATVQTGDERMDKVLKIIASVVEIAIIANRHESAPVRSLTDVAKESVENYMTSAFGQSKNVPSLANPKAAAAELQSTFNLPLRDAEKTVLRINMRVKSKATQTSNKPRRQRQRKAPKL